MGAEDQQQQVRDLLRQMRERLKDCSPQSPPEARSDAEWAILFMSHRIDTLTRTGVLSLPELSLTA